MNYRFAKVNNLHVIFNGLHLFKHLVKREAQGIWNKIHYGQTTYDIGYHTYKLKENSLQQLDVNIRNLWIVGILYMTVEININKILEVVWSTGDLLHIRGHMRNK